MAKEQGPAIVPQNTRRSVETAVLDLSSGIGPVRFATVAHIVLLVIPPELKSVERSVLIASQCENIAGIEQSFDLGLAFYTDLFHFSILREKSSAVIYGLVAFTYERQLIAAM